jgi:hypothetical protein
MVRGFNLRAICLLKKIGTPAVLCLILHMYIGVPLARKFLYRDRIFHILCLTFGLLKLMAKYYLL